MPKIGPWWRKNPLISWEKLGVDALNNYSGRRGTAPFAPERSGGAGPGPENGLDKLLRRVAGWRRVLGGGKRGLLELNGLAIAVQVGDAPGAFGQVLLELGPFRGGQVVEQVFVQELGELAAVH